MVQAMHGAQDPAVLTKRSSWQPLDGTMHAKVQHSVRSVLMLQPLVEGCILRVRREVALEQQPHGVSLHSQRRLHADPHIAELHASHHKVACTKRSTRL